MSGSPNSRGLGGVDEWVPECWELCQGCSSAAPHLPWAAGEPAGGRGPGGPPQPGSRDWAQLFPPGTLRPRSGHGSAAPGLESPVLRECK